MENTEQDGKTLDVVILVNGPGELASYVRPTVEALNKRPEPKRIILVFTPCPYSTGKETEIARNIPGVSKIVPESQFMKWAILRKAPDIGFSKRGIVVFLGGDILYGKVIAKRLNYPAIAYSEAYAKWPKIYRKFLVPDEKILEKFKKQGFPADKMRIVGNLMVDSIKVRKSREELFRSADIDAGKGLISFLPGSRYFQVQFTFLYFAKTAYEINKLGIKRQFAYIISPYLPRNVFDKEMKNAGFKVIRDRIEYKGLSISILTGDQHDWIAASDLVITIPGTNTAEVAVIGTPMISVFPIDSSQMIPLEGIYDIIGRLPFLGFFFKKIYVKIAQTRTRFYAIPNIKTGREIVPDLRGNIQPENIAEKAVFLLNDRNKLDEMRKSLKLSLGEPGASGRIAEEIINEALL